MSTNGNRIRLFSELVTVDAWHQTLSEDRLVVALHADVGFSTARLGAEEASPVRFKLDLRRAELKVIVPITEPLSIDKASVARLEPPRTTTQSTHALSKTSTVADADFNLSLSPQSALPQAGLHAAAARRLEVTREITDTSEIGTIVSTHSTDADGNNRWTFETVDRKSPLRGRPWTASQSPLLNLRSKNASPNSKVSSTVRLELTCLREDLSIRDIVLKDETLLDAAKSKLGLQNRLLAAEAFIRHRLVEDGLPTPRMEEDYAVITLAQIIASEEG